MVAAFTCGEFGHGVVGEREVVEHRVGFLEEGDNCLRGQCIWDEEVAIFLKG